MKTWKVQGTCEDCKMPWYVHAPDVVQEDPAVITDNPCICGGQIIPVKTDDEIARAIARECGVAVLLSLIGRKEKARLFINHIMRVVAANHDAVERWMEARKPRTA